MLLGPKVYFALAAKQDDGHHGSTRLHCDLTDAINVCVFAAPQSDGLPGGARWDIFSPDDTTRLRTVLQVRARSFNVKGMRSTSLRGVLIR